MIRTASLVLAAGLVVSLCSCAPTSPDPELMLPIFDVAPTAEDELPDFVVSGMTGLRAGTGRYLGSDSKGIEYYTLLAEQMGSSVTTCIVAIASVEEWSAACDVNPPISVEIEERQAVLQWPDDPGPEGDFEKISDYLYVETN